MLTRHPFPKYTERLWDSMAGIYTKDDQYMLNYGIKSLNIKWRKGFVNGSHLNLTDPYIVRRLPDQMKTEFIGQGDHGLNIIMVRPELACRGHLCLIDESYRGHYVWHRGQTHHMQDNMRHVAKEGGVWFVRDDWRFVTSSSHVTGIKWLELISDFNSFRLT